GPARAPPDQDAARRPPHQDRRSPASGRARSLSSRVNVSIPALGGQLLPGVQVPRVSLTERVPAEVRYRRPAHYYQIGAHAQGSDAATSRAHSGDYVRGLSLMTVTERVRPM